MSKRKDPKHLEFIRQLPCLRCGCFGSQAAHIRTGTDGGMGLKPSDKFTVPLCHDCHINIQHRVGERKFYNDVYEAIELAKSLYVLSGDKVNALWLISRKRQELF